MRKHKRKTTYSMALLLLAVAAMLGGCGNRRTKASQTQTDTGYVYCTDTRGETLYAIEYKPIHSSYSEVISEYLSEMKSCNGGDGLVSVLPEGLTLRSFTYDSGLLTLDFNAVYNAMDDVQEAMTRSAIVLTMLQLDQVEEVLITVDGHRIQNSLKRDIEPMRREDLMLDWNVVPVTEQKVVK